MGRGKETEDKAVSGKAAASKRQAARRGHRDARVFSRPREAGPRQTPLVTCRARVTFKIATTIFKIRQTRYLAESIEDHVPTRV